VGRAATISASRSSIESSAVDDEVFPPITAGSLSISSTDDEVEDVSLSKWLCCCCWAAAAAAVTAAFDVEVA